MNTLQAKYALKLLILNIKLFRIVSSSFEASKLSRDIFRLNLKLIKFKSLKYFSISSKVFIDLKPTYPYGVTPLPSGNRLKYCFGKFQ